MPRKHLCSLLVCGNRDEKGKFTEKIRWLQRTLSFLKFVQVDINQLIYESENISLDLFLLQGELDSIEVCHRISNKRDFIVVNGACCSLDKTLCVGTIFLPNFAINMEGHQIAFPSFLLKYTKQFAKRHCKTYATGRMLQVKNVITRASNLQEHEEFSDTCIDQETSIIATMCEKTKAKSCAVLYISDNLPLKQTLETVNLDPALLRRKMLAKRNSLLITVNTIMRCVREYESA